VKLAERPSSRQTSRRATQREDDFISKLGLDLNDLSAQSAQRYGYEDEEGILVVNVERGSVAGDKGLQVGDLIKEVDRRKVTSVSQVARIVENIDPGKIILFQVQRGSSNFFVALRKPRS